MLYRFVLPTAGLMLAGLMIGCGSGSPPPQSASVPAGESLDTPDIPQDAQWTILCYIVRGADHVVQGRRLKNDLVQSTGLPDWYVVHGENESTLYYGFYRSVEDSRDRDAARARRDRERVQNFTDARGDRVFQYAQFVPLDLPAADGPPEWDLRNADGFWSLEIATYRDFPERRQAAVEAVRAARQMGIEAYYFHGPTASSVCIGAWPAEAIRAQDAAVAEARQHPGRPIAVFPPGLDPGPRPRDADGNPVQVFVPKIEPVDPTLLEAMREYPHYSVNGYEVLRRVRDPQTGQTQVVPQPTAPVQIPRRQATMLGGGAAPGVAPAQAPAPAAMPPVVPSRPATGGPRLRSIDD